MPKDQISSEIDTELADVHAQIAAAGKEADRHDADYFKCLDADTPDLDGAELSAAARDRALLEKKAYERRISGLEAARAVALEREAAEATAAAKKALEDKLAASETAMLTTFGGDALACQIEVLKGAAAIVDEVNAERARSRKGGDDLSVEVPIAVRAVLTIQLYDPETCGICWNWNGRDMR